MGWGKRLGTGRKKGYLRAELIAVLMAKGGDPLEMGRRHGVSVNEIVRRLKGPGGKKAQEGLRALREMQARMLIGPMLPAVCAGLVKLSRDEKVPPAVRLKAQVELLKIGGVIVDRAGGKEEGVAEEGGMDVETPLVVDAEERRRVVEEVEARMTNDK